MAKVIEIVGHKHFKIRYDGLADSDLRKKQIKEIIAAMRNDVNDGDYIKVKPYPERYKKEGVTNLFVYPLPHGDRLIYTIRTPDKDRKLYQFLDLFTHQEYNVEFGYGDS